GRSEVGAPEKLCASAVTHPELYVQVAAGPRGVAGRLLLFLYAFTLPQGVLDRSLKPFVSFTMGADPHHYRTRVCLLLEPAAENLAEKYERFFQQSGLFVERLAEE